MITRFWCWLFGCDIRYSYNGSPVRYEQVCVRCGKVKK